MLKINRALFDQLTTLRSGRSEHEVCLSWKYDVKIACRLGVSTLPDTMFHRKDERSTADNVRRQLDLQAEKLLYDMPCNVHFTSAGCEARELHVSWLYLGSSLYGGSNQRSVRVELHCQETCHGRKVWVYQAHDKGASGMCLTFPPTWTSHF